MEHKVAVVGATGSVGHEILQILAERDFPAAQVVALSSERATGTEVSYGEDDVLKVKDLGRFDFAGIGLALFAVEPRLAAEHAPRAVKAGAVVVDTSPHFRMEPDVPLVVPEVNAQALKSVGKRGIVATPAGATIAMVMALKPLHELARVRRVVAATYQAVSGAGRDAMDELFNQTRSVYVNDPMVKEHFTKQIAFNVIPHIDAFLPDGQTREEWKLSVETRKILGPDVGVSATCVRVPVFIGHALALNVEFEQPLSVEDARAALRRFPGLSVIDHRADEGYVTPVECSGDDLVFISRLRKDPTNPNALSLWVVTDNLRKGAALNAVQIAEALTESHLKRRKG